MWDIVKATIAFITAQSVVMLGCLTIAACGVISLCVILASIAPPV